MSSEVQSRPAPSRGRGTGRGGRGGGYSTRGGPSRVSNRGAAPNGDSHDTEPTLEDEGEIGQLKQQYGSKISLINEMFPEWSDMDIVYALQEADGDENLAVTRIADGTATQWGEVSKQKKDRARAKAKGDVFTTTTSDSAAIGNARTGRGGRTGVEGGRGRGRATERGGRGGSRGKSTHTPTNGTRSKDTPLSVPTEESSAWETSKPSEDPTSGWGDTTETPTPAAESTTPSAISATPAVSVAPKANVSSASAQKTWASMLRQSTAPKAAPKPKEAPTPKTAEPVIEPLPPAESTPTEPEVEETPAVDESPVEPAAESPPVEHSAVVVPEIALPPSKDQLTETNLDKVDDVSHPPLTETAASEAADSWNPRGADVSATATPLSGPQQKSEQPKSATSGYAATAIKATERVAVRTPSYQRRVLDQEEAVRMPGNRDQVDRAAVQFGAFSLHAPDDDDIDGDREEPETRAQPPVDSPIAHPRTSLPPVQPPPSIPESYAAQKPAATLPPSGPSAAAPTPPSQPSATSQAQPVAQTTQQFARFGQPVPQEPSSFGSQKPFDAFSQPQQPIPASAQNQYEGSFASQATASQPQAPQQPSGAFSSAPNDYSSYYTSEAQNRSQYNNYYNQQFSQQQGSQGPPEGPSSQQPQSTQQQRSYMASSYNAPATELNMSQYPQAHAQRYGSGSALDNSGNTTPNPSAVQAPQQAGQSAQAPGQGQQPHDYSYSQHPYFSSPYYAAYMNQYQGGYNQGSYGGPYGKGGYGQPHQYGMNPQGPYGSSPAGGFGQSSLHRADSGSAAGLGDFGRATSSQAAAQPGLGSSGFGGSIHDTYSRSGAYGSQAGQPFNAAGSQAGNPPTDELKPYGDAKAVPGPSPSMGGARPGSAANNTPQSGLPPAQSGQQGGLGMSGYGSYPGHLQGQGLHGAAQSGGSGYGMSASGGQGHGTNPYGGQYGGGQGFGGGGSYYGNQPRGWGGNYH